MNEMNPCDQSVAKHLESLKQAGYQPAELDQIGPLFALLGVNARTYWQRLFLSARGAKVPIPLESLLLMIQQAWESSFQNGTPGRLGDPDDPAAPNVGMMNTAALYQLYADAGLSSPRML